MFALNILLTNPIERNSSKINSVISSYTAAGPHQYPTSFSRKHSREKSKEAIVIGTCGSSFTSVDSQNVSDTQYVHIPMNVVGRSNKAEQNAQAPVCRVCPNHSRYMYLVHTYPRMRPTHMQFLLAAVKNVPMHQTCIFGYLAEYLQRVSRSIPRRSD